MGEGRRHRRVCQAANATALRAAFDVSSCAYVRMISIFSEAKRGEKALCILSTDF